MENLLEVRNLKKYFPVHSGIFSRHSGDIKAVEQVSFTLKKGETLGIVGESGCGKTTVGRCILRLLQPTGGEIFFQGREIFDPQWSPMEFASCVQMVFQNPLSSLNPRKAVSELIGESLLVHGKCQNRSQMNEAVEALLNLVGMDFEYLLRYPHELSGGQRQRVGIARAIALSPSLIVCDESVSALDVSVQAQVLNLLMDLKDSLGLSYLFIAHDLRVVYQIADRIAVMYMGQIAEIASVGELFEVPSHPYTRSLLSAILPIHGSQGERIRLSGEVPSALNPPPGCSFATRCPDVLPVCREINPQLKWISATHQCRCHLVSDRRNNEKKSGFSGGERRKSIEVVL